MKVLGRCLWFAEKDKRVLRLGLLCVRNPMIVFVVWFLLLYFDAGGYMLVGLAVSFWHELGHILCWLVMFRSAPRLTVSVSGIALDVSWVSLSDGYRLILAAAGPAMNFLAAAWLYRTMDVRATVSAAAYWAANLLIGGFNLLPISPLDGYQILSAGWKFWSNKLLFRRE